MNYSKMTSNEFPDWFVDLLVLRATDGLDEQQQQQFDKFVEEHANREQIEIEAEKYELTVAAIDLKFQQPDPRRKDELPASLRDKLLADAKQHFADEPQETETVPAPVVERASQQQGLSSREAFAWLIAAASVVLLLTGFNPFAGPAPGDDGPKMAVTSKPTVEEEFNEFVSGEEADLVRVAWAPQGDSTASGEVAWRDSSQEGYMVFEGLRPNNPLQSQYQLWIFDAKTDKKFPIDGGVFDVAAGTRTVVPIDAKLNVEGPVMFAITEEVPGGVVVSSRERLPLLAQVGP